MIHNGLDSIATHPQKLPGIFKKTYFAIQIDKIRLFPLTHHFIYSKFIQCPGRSTSVTSAKTTYKTQILWDVFFEFSGLQAIKIQGHQRNNKKSKSKANLPKFNGNLRGNPTPPHLSEEIAGLLKGFFTTIIP